MYDEVFSNANSAKCQNTGLGNHLLIGLAFSKVGFIGHKIVVFRGLDTVWLTQGFLCLNTILYAARYRFRTVFRTRQLLNKALLTFASLCSATLLKGYEGSGLVKGQVSDVFDAV